MHVTPVADVGVGFLSSLRVWSIFILQIYITLFDFNAIFHVILYYLNQPVQNENILYLNLKVCNGYSSIVHLAFDRNLMEEYGSFGFGDFFQHFLDQAYSLLLFLGL